MGHGAIQNENIQALATEMFKVFTGITPRIITNYVNELWRNLRHQPDFSVRPVKNVYFGTDLLSYLRSKICDFWSCSTEENGISKSFQIWHSKVEAKRLL